MEINTKLTALSKKVDQLKNEINTEEATKTAFVLPFINALGYDIFNPTEVVPEFTADIGLKKGEKVDYAIFNEGSPILIIECKNWKEDLNVHDSQLFRYFHVTHAKFALLTNGIHFRFYTDLEVANKMDEKPFLDFDITQLKESTIAEIAKFHKSNFDAESIFDNASSLKHIKGLKQILNEEFTNPSPELVRLLTSQVYNGRITEKVLQLFTGLVQKSIGSIISEKVNDRLTSALSKESEQQQEEEKEPEKESKINTTEEELEAYNIVLAIARRLIDKSRIAHRDTQSYFGILLDDNNRKPICRLHLNGGKKQISIFDAEKIESKFEINSIDEIYDHQDKIISCIESYLSE